MMTNENPWENLKTPKSLFDLELKLINTNLPDGIEANWAMTPHKEPALYVEAPCYIDEEITILPFKNIGISTGNLKNEEKNFLLVFLKDEDSQIPFWYLCNDVISALERADRFNYRKIILCRLEKWRILLSASKQHLGFKEQKGLVAELKFLQREALQALEPVVAVSSWTGCFDSPRDFSFGQLFVEVKANQGSQKPFVTISSEFQLSCNKAESVKLYVVELNESPVDGFTLFDVIEETREVLKENVLAGEQLEIRLASAGYDERYEYAFVKWSEGETHCYSVEEGFPRIDAGELPSGVSGVGYTLDLRECDDFEIADEELINEIRSHM